MRFIHGHNSTGMNRSKPWKSNRYVAEDRGFTTPCWIWQLKISKVGYGVLKVAGRDWLAHRWHYEQAKGPIPDGMQLDHLCRVRECVNPDHLEPITPIENSRRSRATKLDPTKAAMIEELARAGHSVQAIASAFAVTRETVYLIKKNGADGPRRPRR